MADYEGGPGDDVHTGTAAGETLHGRGGNDTLDGAYGDDFIYGDDGNDVLMGGNGNDLLDGGTGNDKMAGGDGDDTYYVDTQNDLVFEAYSFDGTSGYDTVISTVSYYLYPNIEKLVLAPGAGDLYGVGNDAQNWLMGNEGNNLLIGGVSDFVDGQAGNDRLFSTDGFASGGEGDDTIVGTGSILAHGDGGADTIYGGNGGDTLFGDGDPNLPQPEDCGSDLLVGGAGNDMLYGVGRGEQDFLYGGTGNDNYVVDGANDLTFEQPGEEIDTVYAQTGADSGVYLYASIENLYLQGTTGYGVGNELDNQITGSDSANLLLGGAGNDRIEGRGGNDVLFGQDGADTFVFARGSGTGQAALPDSGQDVIGDFTPGTDKIDITAYGLHDFARIQTLMTEYQGSTAIDLGNGNFIVLNGVTEAQLHAGDFVGTAPADSVQTPVATDDRTIAADRPFNGAHAHLWTDGGLPDHLFL